ncbi:hypothetical protein [Haloferula sp. BvORR071]|uniref:hypothetical protein n=1 Tax=Haloferula sp. BvORR071 TaxID=1396141 RepID=UPI000553212A|nr:hypothetical protein [Haloferula sp. BvORR071]
MSFIALLLLIGPNIGFWIGLMGLRGSSRRGSWWLMASGIGAFTLGPILAAAVYFNWFGRIGPGGPSTPLEPLDTLIIGGVLAVPVGMLLFAAGFVLHGMEMARAQQRAKELENLAAAMGEELNRFRGA